MKYEMFYLIDFSEQLWRLLDEFLRDITSQIQSFCKKVAKEVVALGIAHNRINKINLQVTNAVRQKVIILRTLSANLDHLYFWKASVSASKKQNTVTKVNVYSTVWRCYCRTQRSHHGKTKRNFQDSHSTDSAVHAAGISKGLWRKWYRNFCTHEGPCNRSYSSKEKGDVSFCVTIPEEPADETAGRVLYVEFQLDSCFTLVDINTTPMHLHCQCRN